jgi:hypothetical protein
MEFGKGLHPGEMVNLKHEHSYCFKHACLSLQRFGMNIIKSICLDFLDYLHFLVNLTVCSELFYFVYLANHSMTS